MAVIDYDTLIAWIKQHPNYKEFEMGVGAEFSLVIRFAESDGTAVQTDSIELANGYVLYYDINQDGRVFGIEIH